MRVLKLSAGLLALLARPVLTRRPRKKTAQSYAALRNETRPIGTRKMPSSLPEDGINHGLLPPYLCHPLDGTANGPSIFRLRAD